MILVGGSRSGVFSPGFGIIFTSACSHLEGACHIANGHLGTPSSRTVFDKRVCDSDSPSCCVASAAANGSIDFVHRYRSVDSVVWDALIHHSRGRRMIITKAIALDLGKQLVICALKGVYEARDLFFCLIFFCTAFALCTTGLECALALKCSSLAMLRSKDWLCLATA